MARTKQTARKSTYRRQGPQESFGHQGFHQAHFLCFLFFEEYAVYKSNRMYVCVPAIGIDLGTTYSCVGVWLDDRVEIIANDQGNRTTPSYVAFTDSERFIGDPAKNQVAMNAINIIFGEMIQGTVSSQVDSFINMGSGGGKRRKDQVPAEILEIKQDGLMKNRPTEDKSKLTGMAFGPAYQVLI
ncbi:hypothetical protein RND81_14G065100 [Saponaria officinalis]|uniref:Uncharacterized protein n=1 Tax=Saponaria officinalis TaxID=3572 RepID=A0AAW1GM81_SAPOF